MSFARPPDGTNALSEGRREAPRVSSIRPARPPAGALPLGRTAHIAAGEPKMPAAVLLH